jgi:5S rRNA maturation endonuclease (ribonuclease M5)
VTARVTRYELRDTSGSHVATHVRHEGASGKRFTWELPDGTLGLGGIPVSALPLYGSEHIADWAANERIIVVEGEKAAEALRSCGFLALGTVTGAASAPDRQAIEPLRNRHVLLWPDADGVGRKHMEAVGKQLAECAASINLFEWRAAPEHGDAADYLEASNATDRLRADLKAARPWQAAETGRTQEKFQTPWALAQSAPEFLSTSEPDGDFLEPRLLARGSLTLWMSPRGSGKTHAMHELAVRQARGGRRVLVIDRDNSRRELKRRLWGWGAAEVAGLKVLGRDKAPPLTDRRAWESFPFGEYDFVAIDSLDASTEGVGEQDSAQSSRALASLLDIAHTASGPAILVLGNTVKSGSHGRGSGVIEDRADIVYEVRDATQLRPTGKQPWWLELPVGDRASWGDRAARRRRRDAYRLAFVPSKYRIGQEPDPFVMEIRLPEDGLWVVVEVTDEIEVCGQEALAAADRNKTERVSKAVAALRERVEARGVAGLDINEEAVPLLMQLELPRELARTTIRDLDKSIWRIEGTGRKGDPKVLFAISRSATPAGMEPRPEPHGMRLGDSGMHADRMESERQESPLTDPAQECLGGNVEMPAAPESRAANGILATVSRYLPAGPLRDFLRSQDSGSAS